MRKKSIALAVSSLVLVVFGCAGADDGGSMNTGTGGASPVGGGAAAGSGGMSAAGSGGKTAGSSGTSAAGTGGKAVGSGGASGASGTGGMPPGGGGMSGMTAGAGGGTAGSGGAGPSGPVEPIIPEINGECPTFAEGENRVTVMGISATVIAGPKKEGTGSLLFYWYGTGGLGGVTSLPQAIKDEITAEGGIVFAQNAALNTGGDCSGTGTFGIDDFKISDQVVACAVKNYGINPKRIYATGCSAGGLTTGCMGIMRSNYIAAVAPNSGGVTIGYGDLQNPMHVPDSITMNGGAGDNVIVNFGNTSEAYDNYILKYGGFAVNCIHSSGHCGAPSALYGSAWQFLKDHPFGTPKPDPYASGLPSGFHDSCEVFQMTDMAPLGGF